MNLYLILFAAIAFEGFGTMLLPESQNLTKVFPSMFLLISYFISFYLLSFLSQKLSLALIYASWAGLGVFSITFLSYTVLQTNIKLAVSYRVVFDCCRSDYSKCV
jgi:small multidrug resistance pump